MSREEAEVARLLAQRIAVIGDRTIDPTSPVYIDTGKARPEAAGSAILLRVGEAHFVLTAAHVLDLTAKADVYIGGTRLLALGGRYITSPLPRDGQRDNDRIDIAIFPLTPEQVAALGDAVFVEVGATAPGHVTDPTPRSGSYYLVAGYPLSKQPKTIPDTILKAQPVYLAAKALPAENISEMGLDPRNHILLEFDREAVWAPGGTRTAPAPTGMSGGGIWVVDGLLTPTPKPEVLVAIATEWDRDAKTILGTRIGLCFDAIGDHHPGLKPLLPVPPGV
jgi:hypothetical protein